MRTLEPGETLILPDNQVQTCARCGLWARGAHNIDIVFGFRRMGRGKGHVRPQVWCKRCRSMPRERTTEAEQQSWERVRGGCPGVVYALHAVGRHMTKWGYTQQDPFARARTIQTSCPDDLELLGCYGADYFAETEVHRELAERLVRGEWFEMTREEALEMLEARGGALLVANDDREVDA